MYADASFGVAMSARRRQNRTVQNESEELMV
jgi:hypothetical protein